MRHFWGVQMDIQQLEKSTVRKVTLRLIPFLFLCFTISILDRVNIGFAALRMNQDLGFSDAVFGFGAGIFFIGYFLLEVPGSAIMTRIGARRWISRIMVSWGIIAVIMAFIQTPLQFYIVRLLLGAAEASFYPCMVHYLSGFFQSKHHAKAIAGFMIAIPAANAIGSPISTFLLQHGWLGLAGWQWLFILEAIPAIILGFVCYFYLTDRIEEAKWLTEEEKTWLLEIAGPGYGRFRHCFHSDGQTGRNGGDRLRHRVPGIRRGILYHRRRNRYQWRIAYGLIGKSHCFGM